MFVQNDKLKLEHLRNNNEYKKHFLNGFDHLNVKTM